MGITQVICVNAYLALGFTAVVVGDKGGTFLCFMSENSDSMKPPKIKKTFEDITPHSSQSVSLVKFIVIVLAKLLQFFSFSSLILLILGKNSLMEQSSEKNVTKTGL